MRILDRYISRSIVSVFLSTILTFSFLYILIDVFSHLDDYIERKVALDLLVQYYATFLPIIIIHTSPIALLMATLLTYSTLNNQNEIIALRASGLNFFKITRPALCIAFLVAALVFLVNERFVPQSTMMTQEIKETHIKANADEKTKDAKLINNLTFYGLKNRLYFIDTYNPQTFEINGITIIGHDDAQNLVSKVIAVRGVWTGIAWKFYNCQITTYDPATPNKTLEVKQYPEKLMDIKESPSDFLKQRMQVSAMNIKALQQYIKRFSGSGAVRAINNLKVDLYQKMAYPAGNIVIVLAGLPLALMTGRRKAMTFTSLGLAMTIGFLYYVLNAVGLALGKGGALPPFTAAWLAPFIFLILAVVLIKKKF